MSRYELQPKSYTPRVARAAVGWDRPLQTFFAQVLMKPTHKGEEEDVTLWRGTAPGEIPEAADALALVEPYAIVPEDMLARLEADRERTRGQADGPMQLGMKKIIFPPSND